MNETPSSSPARLRRRRRRQRIRIVAELLIGGAAIWFVANPKPFPTPPTPEAVSDSTPELPAPPESTRILRDTATPAREAPFVRLPRTVVPSRLVPRGRLFRSIEERARAGERIAVSVTAYCLQGRTRRGNLVRDGIIAADRKLFPLGREVDLWFGREKYGRFLADDTGGVIIGGIIDVWMPDCKAARRFGRRRGYAQLVPREP
ncbi:MAG TPA: 3D domain-containing protein [Gemmatimonadaceae bacterium]|nr:3D domain-containing protein [Gemmatimonadaceae bacterium]